MHRWPYLKERHLEPVHVTADVIAACDAMFEGIANCPATVKPLTDAYQGFYSVTRPDGWFKLLLGSVKTFYNWMHDAESNWGTKICVNGVMMVASNEIPTALLMGYANQGLEP